MTTIQAISEVLLYGCLIASWAFVAGYAIVAPWHRTQIGRHMMATTAALAVIFTDLALMRLHILGPLGDATRAWTAVGAYGLMFVVLVWRLIILAHLQLVARRRFRKQEQS